MASVQKRENNSISRTCIAIDLKSYYASVECVERGLDPLTTFLVVADASRTNKTICLAVTPALKAFGISGRARLFEVVRKVDEVNALRRRIAPGHKLTRKVTDMAAFQDDPYAELDYIIAPPRMSLYIKKSAEIYQIYLKYFAPEDVHVYSIDEVFIDATKYRKMYRISTHDLIRTVIQDILRETGITATAGIGTNLYLAKVAMDIVAKKAQPDKDGVRIAELDELSYRKLLWDHLPLTDFWRIGPGYARKLEKNGLYTMGDIARCSLGGKDEYYNEDLLYKLFGIGAETLIDHAWGWEPCTIAEIKSYKPKTKCLGSGQVLPRPYKVTEGKIIVEEMLDSLASELLRKQLVTDQITITISYDSASLQESYIERSYMGEIKTDYYGRKVPTHAHGTTHLPKHTSSSEIILGSGLGLFDRIIDPNLLIRRVNVVAENVFHQLDERSCFEQLSLFSNFAEEVQKRGREERRTERDRAVLAIRDKYGKNAILKGTNFLEGATMRERNQQIGGHRA